MATIGETIDLNIPVATAREKWSDYVSGMVIGSGKGPGETEQPFRWRKAERDAEEGVVHFIAVDDRVTRFTVALDFPTLRSEDPTSGARVEELRAYLRYDLDLFREFAEGRLRLTG